MPTENGRPPAARTTGVRIHVFFRQPKGAEAPFKISGPHTLSRVPGIGEYLGIAPDDKPESRWWRVVAVLHIPSDERDVDGEVWVVPEEHLDVVRRVEEANPWIPSSAR